MPSFSSTQSCLIGNSKLEGNKTKTVKKCKPDEVYNRNAMKFVKSNDFDIAKRVARAMIGEVSDEIMKKDIQSLKISSVFKTTEGSYFLGNKTDGCSIRNSVESDCKIKKSDCIDSLALVTVKTDDATKSFGSLVQEVQRLRSKVDLCEKNAKIDNDNLTKISSQINDKFNSMAINSFSSYISENKLETATKGKFDSTSLKIFKNNNDVDISNVKMTEVKNVSKFNTNERVNIPLSLDSNVSRIHRTREPENSINDHHKNVSHSVSSNDPSPVISAEGKLKKNEASTVEHEAVVQRIEPQPVVGDNNLFLLGQVRGEDQNEYDGNSEPVVHMEEVLTEVESIHSKEFNEDTQDLTNHCDKLSEVDKCNVNNEFSSRELISYNAQSEDGLARPSCNSPLPSGYWGDLLPEKMGDFFSSTTFSNHPTLSDLSTDWLMGLDLLPQTEPESIDIYTSNLHSAVEEQNTMNCFRHGGYEQEYIESQTGNVYFTGGDKLVAYQSTLGKLSTSYSDTYTSRTESNNRNNLVSSSASCSKYDSVNSNTVSKNQVLEGSEENNRTVLLGSGEMKIESRMSISNLPSCARLSEENVAEELPKINILASPEQEIHRIRPIKLEDAVVPSTSSSTNQFRDGLLIPQNSQKGMFYPLPFEKIHQLTIFQDGKTGLGLKLSVTQPLNVVPPVVTPVPHPVLSIRFQSNVGNIDIPRCSCSVCINNYAIMYKNHHDIKAYNKRRMYYDYCQRKEQYEELLRNIESTMEPVKTDKLEIESSLLDSENNCGPIDSNVMNVLPIKKRKTGTRSVALKTDEINPELLSYPSTRMISIADLGNKETQSLTGESNVIVANDNFTEVPNSSLNGGSSEVENKEQKVSGPPGVKESKKSLSLSKRERKAVKDVRAEEAAHSLINLAHACEQQLTTISTTASEHLEEKQSRKKQKQGSRSHEFKRRKNHSTLR